MSTLRQSNVALTDYVTHIFLSGTQLNENRNGLTLETISESEKVGTTVSEWSGETITCVEKYYVNRGYR